MLNIQSSNLVPSYARTDAPRRESRAEIKLRIRNRSFIVPGHGLVTENDADKGGWITAYPYESDLPKIQALVETENATIKAAHKTNFRKLRAKAAEVLGKSVDEIPADIEHWDDDAKRVAARWGGSMEAEFYAITGRGLLPILELDVVTRGLPPPQTDEEKAMLYLTSQMQTANQSAHNEQLLAAVAKLSAQVAEQAEVIAKLQTKK